MLVPGETTVITASDLLLLSLVEPAVFIECVAVFWLRKFSFWEFRVGRHVIEVEIVGHINFPLFRFNC